MQTGDLAGQSLGHYRVKRQIGYGGMATVFLAEDIHLGREVALKVFWPRPGETQDFLKRFIQEARILAQLDHPHILPVYDYGEQGLLAYLVMPYLSGGTLKELLEKRKALPPSEAIELLNQVLPALQYAHERNLIHRDIKPANLLFKNEHTLMLADFGLVKVARSAMTETSLRQTTSQESVSVVGTPEYMAPEQIEGKAVLASDIYSMGLVLYEMVTGTRPFSGSGLLDTLMKQAHEPPRPPRELNPYISFQLEATILRALEKQPLRRFAQPKDFRQALLLTSNTPTSYGYAGNPDSYGGLARTPQPQDKKTPPPMPASPTLYPLDTQPVYPNVPRVGSQNPTVISPFPGEAPAPLQLQSASPAYPSAVTQPDALTRMRGRKRRSVALLVVPLLLLLALVSTLFLTPLGSTLFVKKGFSLTVTPSTSTPRPGSLRGNIPTPNTTTQPLSATTTACPLTNTGRAAVMAPLALNNAASVVYSATTPATDGKAASGSLKLYNTVTTDTRTLAEIDQATIDEAQISNDGQWVLFATTVEGRSELRLVRLDGNGEQTLFCAPAGMTIKNSQWSIDTRYVVFDEFPLQGEPTLSLLNTQTGQFWVEIPPPDEGIALVPRTWLDNDRVLLVGLEPGSAQSQNIYVLDTRNGPNESLANAQQVFDSNNSPCWDFDSSYDGKTLYTTQCTQAQPTGSSTISTQQFTGSPATNILDSASIAFTNVRVIEATGKYLFALASDSSTENASGDTQNDGIYLLTRSPQGMVTQKLSGIPVGQHVMLNTFSQYFWSNVSRDGQMYALQGKQIGGSDYTLFTGSLDGGAPTAFAHADQFMAIIGWTTI